MEAELVNIYRETINGVEVTIDSDLNLFVGETKIGHTTELDRFYIADLLESLGIPKLKQKSLFEKATAIDRYFNDDLFNYEPFLRLVHNYNDPDLFELVDKMLRWGGTEHEFVYNPRLCNPLIELEKNAFDLAESQCLFNRKTVEINFKGTKYLLGYNID